MGEVRAGPAGGRWWERDLIRAMSLGGGEDTQLVPFTPYDETAIVTPQDHGLWQDNHGGPRDPQRGQRRRLSSRESGNARPRVQTRVSMSSSLR